MVCLLVWYVAEMNLKAMEAAEKAVAAKVDMEKAAAAAIASAHRSWIVSSEYVSNKAMLNVVSLCVLSISVRV